MGERSTSEILDVLRSTYERFVAAFDSLGEEELTTQSYDDDWSVAQVASHLGSGTEIFGHQLAAGAAGEPAADGINEAIWDAWNAKQPGEQVRDAIAGIRAFLDAAEALPDDVRERWRLSLFGLDLDLEAFLAMRLNEQVLHTWDVTVALDPGSTLTPEAAGWSRTACPRSSAGPGSRRRSSSRSRCGPPPPSSPSTSASDRAGPAPPVARRHRRADADDAHRGVRPPGLRPPRPGAHARGGLSRGRRPGPAPGFVPRAVTTPRENRLADTRHVRTSEDVGNAS